MGRKLRSEGAEEADFGFFCEEAPGTGPCAQVRAAARADVVGERRWLQITHGCEDEVPMRFYRVFGPGYLSATAF